MALALAALRIFESQSHGFQTKQKPEHHYVGNLELLNLVLTNKIVEGWS
jgi:hypothetical protein